jgi:hypothetical protein
MRSLKALFVLLAAMAGDATGTRTGMETRLKRYSRQQDRIQDFNSLALKDSY